MTKQLTTSVKVYGIAIALAGSLLMAQTGRPATAEIPFGFEVNGHTLPAGHYIISQQNYPGLIELYNRAEKVHVVVMAGLRQHDQTVDPKLVFRCYGSHHFLAQVWLPETSGQGFAPSKLEKELNKGQSVVASVETLDLNRQ